MTHTKRTFIQDYVIRAAPAPEQVDAAVARAEQVWDRLHGLGYGAAKPHEPREAGVDWYAKLEEDQRRAFDRFWKAYGYKKGKAGAAMRWAQLFESSRARPAPTVGAAHGRDDSGAGLDAERIIQAAAAEARAWRENPPQGQTRIYAQGWLEARRWEDYEPTAASPKKQPNADVSRSHLVNELAAIKRLYDASPNETLARQIEALEAKLHG